MAKDKQALEMYYSGINCGQIVATFLSEICGFDENDGRAAMCGFGMGLYNVEVYGAIAGGIYSLGIYCNHCKSDDNETQKKISDMTRDLTSHFLDKYGSLRCVHFSGEGNHNRCWDYIRETDEFVRKLFKEDKLG